MGTSPTRQTKQKSDHSHNTRLTEQKSGRQPHKTYQTKIWASSPQDRPNQNLIIIPTRQD
jgi:hypothetical protein